MNERRALNARMVQKYFDAVNTRDSRTIGSLFAPDGELVTGWTVVGGAEKLRDFYESTAFAVHDLETVPGPLVVGDDRVASEVRLRMAGNVTIDPHFFSFEGDRIRRLVVYTGSAPPSVTS